MEWLRQADEDGSLAHALASPEDAEVREIAGLEGWILGVEPTRVTPAVHAKYAESATRSFHTPNVRRRRSAQLLREQPRMPEISRFHGIVIGMFYEEHGRPHFHARFGDFKISVEIEQRVVRGEFPGSALRRVLDWQRARTGAPLQRIDPLP